MDGEKETIIMGAVEVICFFFLEEKIYTTDQKLVNTSTHAYLRGAQNTHTIQDPLRMVRQAGGRKGWRVLPPAQKTKKNKVKSPFLIPEIFSR